MTHRTNIISGTTTVLGYCSCGFTTRAFEKKDLNQCRAKINDHKISELTRQGGLDLSEKTDRK